MIDTAMHSVLVDVPRALSIWLILLASASVAVIGLWVVAGRQRNSRRKKAAERSDEAARSTRVTEDLSRNASQLAVAADQAAAVEQRRRRQWRLASERAEAAWQAYVRADSRARRIAAAMAFPVRRNRRSSYSGGERERHLHRMATAAFWRKELSILQLSDALAHRNGWDPRRHPVEQEMAICRFVRDAFLAEYRAAANRERTAWQAVEAAAAPARSLRAEAVVAAARAHRATDVPQPRHPRGRPAVHRADRPGLASRLTPAKAH